MFLNRKQVLDHLVGHLRKAGWSAQSPKQVEWIHGDLGGTVCTISVESRTRGRIWEHKQGMAISMPGYGSIRTTHFGVWVEGWEDRVVSRLREMQSVIPGTRSTAPASSPTPGL